MKEKREMDRKLYGFAMMLFLAAFCVIFCNDEALARDSSGNLVVIVDPGHGDDDPGASGNGVVEEDCNWAIALSLKAQLETYEGVKVYLTRGSAEWFSNTGRARLGYLLGADLFISCHINSSSSSTPCGVTVYGQVNATYAANGKTLSNMIATNIASLGLVNRGYATRSASSDSSRDYYTVLDESARAGIMGIIIEHAFVSNASDAAFLKSRANLTNLGIQDALAIAQYYGLTKRTVSNGDEITLTRTYSAYFEPSTTGGTYSSSDSSVAYVSSSGTITACSQGTAVITYTDTSGNTESVTIMVPAVTLVGIAAGNTKTFYDNVVSEYNSSNTVVKAIYSDGSVTQVSGWSGSALNATSDTSTTTGYGAYYSTIEYGGFSCKLILYNDSTLSSVKAAASSLITPNTSNTDILVYPNGNTDYTGEAATTVAATTTTQTTTTTTQAVTTAEEENTTTEEETTTTEEETTEEESTEETSETTDEETKETQSVTSVKEEDESLSAVKVVAVGIIIIVVAGGVIFGLRKPVMKMKKK